MRKVIIVAMAVAAGLAAVRYGPALAQRGMKKCHEMMASMPERCQETRGSGVEPSSAGTI